MRKRESGPANVLMKFVLEIHEARKGKIRELNAAKNSTNNKGTDTMGFGFDVHLMESRWVNVTIHRNWFRALEDTQCTRYAFETQQIISASHGNKKNKWTHRFAGTSILYRPLSASPLSTTPVSRALISRSVVWKRWIGYKLEHTTSSNSIPYSKQSSSNSASAGKWTEEAPKTYWIGVQEQRTARLVQRK